VNYDDETLMAYADGELDEPQRSEITQALERDPELARRVARHRVLRAEVAGAYANVLSRPMPERLLKAAQRESDPSGEPGARRGTVVQFPARASQAPATSWRLREWGAMAASLAIGAVISWKLFAPPESAFSTRSGGLVASGSLASALDSQLASNQTGNEPVLIGLSFRMQDGQYCRSFELTAAATAGLACRVDDEWRVPVTAASPAHTGGVRQAASPPPAVMQVIQARISGEALDAAGEENAQRAGWNPAYGRR
jgi:hypothetical protein